MLFCLYLVLERRFRKFSSAATQAQPKLVTMLSIFVLVSLTWIPFRATDTGNALAILQGLLTSNIDSKLDPFSALLALVAILATLIWQIRMRDSSLETLFSHNSPLQNIALLASALLLIFLFSGGERHAFIYFQF